MREITYAHSDPCIDYERRHNYLLPPAGSLFFPTYMVKGFEKMILHSTFLGFITSMLIMNE